MSVSTKSRSDSQADSVGGNWLEPFFVEKSPQQEASQEPLTEAIEQATREAQEAARQAVAEAVGVQAMGQVSQPELERSHGPELQSAAVTNKNVLSTLEQIDNETAIKLIHGVIARAAGLEYARQQETGQNHFSRN